MCLHVWLQDTLLEALCSAACESVSSVLIMHLLPICAGLTCVLETGSEHLPAECRPDLCAGDRRGLSTSLLSAGLSSAGDERGLSTSLLSPGLSSVLETEGG